MNEVCLRLFCLLCLKKSFKLWSQLNSDLLTFSQISRYFCKMFAASADRQLIGGVLSESRNAYLPRTICIIVLPFNTRIPEGVISTPQCFNYITKFVIADVNFNFWWIFINYM